MNHIAPRSPPCDRAVATQRPPRRTNPILTEKNPPRTAETQCLRCVRNRYPSPPRAPVLRPRGPVHRTSPRQPPATSRAYRPRRVGPGYRFPAGQRRSQAGNADFRTAGGSFASGVAGILTDRPAEWGQELIHQHAYRCDRCGSMQYFADGYLAHPLPTGPESDQDRPRT